MEFDVWNVAVQIIDIGLNYDGKIVQAKIVKVGIEVPV